MAFIYAQLQKNHQKNVIQKTGSELNSPPVLQHTGTKLVTSHIWYRWKANFMENHYASCPIDPSSGQNVTDKNPIGPFAIHWLC